MQQYQYQYQFPPARSRGWGIGVEWVVVIGVVIAMVYTYRDKLSVMIEDAQSRTIPDEEEPVEETNGPHSATSDPPAAKPDPPTTKPDVSQSTTSAWIALPVLMAFGAGYGGARAARTEYGAPTGPQVLEFVFLPGLVVYVTSYLVLGGSAVHWGLLLVGTLLGVGLGMMHTRQSNEEKKAVGGDEGTMGNDGGGGGFVSRLMSRVKTAVGVEDDVNAGEIVPPPSVQDRESTLTGALTGVLSRAKSVISDVVPLAVSRTMSRVESAVGVGSGANADTEETKVPPKTGVERRESFYDFKNEGDAERVEEMLGQIDPSRVPRKIVLHDLKVFHKLMFNLKADENLKADGNLPRDRKWAWVQQMNKAVKLYNLLGWDEEKVDQFEDVMNKTLRRSRDKSWSGRSKLNDESEINRPGELTQTQALARLVFLYKVLDKTEYTGHALYRKMAGGNIKTNELPRTSDDIAPPLGFETWGDFLRSNNAVPYTLEMATKDFNFKEATEWRKAIKWAQTLIQTTPDAEKGEKGGKD